MPKLRSRSIVGDTQKHNTRPVSDFYPTPNNVTNAILPHVDLFGQGWEPACGQGHMHKLLPDGTYATDLHNHGYGETGVDFLLEFREVDWIMTNPPFKYAQQFIEHGLCCVKPGGQVIMILKMAFLSGVARSRWLRSSGLKYVYIFSRRVRFDAETAEEDRKGGMLDFCWYVWEKGHSGEPVIRWLYN